MPTAIVTHLRFRFLPPRRLSDGPLFRERWMRHTDSPKLCLSDETLTRRAGLRARYKYTMVGAGILETAQNRANAEPRRNAT